MTSHTCKVLKIDIYRIISLFLFIYELLDWCLTLDWAIFQLHNGDQNFGGEKTRHSQRETHTNRQFAERFPGSKTSVLHQDTA